jgi:acyl carrier protein
MTAGEDPRRECVVTLIREVKPSLSDHPIRPQDCLINDLGLDSLDLLQLCRKVTRTLDSGFDMEAWEEAQPDHRRSVQSLLDCLRSADR